MIRSSLFWNILPLASLLLETLIACQERKIKNQSATSERFNTCHIERVFAAYSHFIASAARREVELCVEIVLLWNISQQERHWGNFPHSCYLLWMSGLFPQIKLASCWCQTSRITSDCRREPPPRFSKLQTSISLKGRIPLTLAPEVLRNRIPDIFLQSYRHWSPPSNSGFHIP